MKTKNDDNEIKELTEDFINRLNDIDDFDGVDINIGYSKNKLSDIVINFSHNDTKEDQDE